MWLDAFKLALITKNEKRLLLLIDDLPSFSTLHEMHQALALIEETITFFESKKELISTEMSKIRDAKKYLLASI